MLLDLDCKTGHVQFLLFLVERTILGLVQGLVDFCERENFVFVATSITP
jgi:hypothetical protein